MAEADKFITVDEAASLLPRKFASLTVWRWMRKGVKARSGGTIRLKHVRFGGRLYTTPRDVFAFAEQLAKADEEHFDQVAASSSAPRHRSPSEAKRNREIADARQRVDNALRRPKALERKRLRVDIA